MACDVKKSKKIWIQLYDTLTQTIKSIRRVQITHSAQYIYAYSTRFKIIIHVEEEIFILFEQ